MKYLIYAISMVMFSMLVGCGRTPTTKIDSTIMKAMAEAEKECLKTFQPDLTSIPKEHKSLVAMMSQSNFALLSATVGNPCKQVNVYDAQIAEVKYKNEMLGKALDGLFDLGKWYVGASAVVDVASKISNYHVEGQFNELGVENHNDSANSWSSYEDSNNMFDTSPIDSNVSTWEQSN